MKTARKMVMVMAMALAGASALWAQMMGMRPPQIPGEFKPVVGSGSQYTMTTKKDSSSMDMAYAIVGKESVDGQDGYWMEIRMLSGKGGGMIMKQLMVIGGDQPGIKRMIMQMAGRPPMEMPMSMMSMMKNMPKAQESGQASGKNHGMGELVGTESVTVPAGTFECQHYRSQSDRGSADVWITTKISPYGLVKMTSTDSTMVLAKVLSNETSQIKGEPQPMPGMPH
ncbi:MAG TPA: hypothetical protein VKV95_10410 [Terriglobia bacterium]|nr:hypothetical protein [Terriglobia bacterium]